ncbi:MAG: hypothetical protein HQ510_01865 [Candidatus Marinimicrobia bacterium]|nr:hypothetical protein [Candidatus Neomarinimicrobiota bacterium]
METCENTIIIFLQKWQDILRLRDWEISVVLADKDWRKSGDIKIDQDNKLAALMINQNLNYSHLEAVVIHELVHLKLWGMDQMIEDLMSSVYGSDKEDPKHSFAYGEFMGILESTTQDLTKALISATGEERKMFSKRIEREVNKELGKV